MLTEPPRRLGLFDAISIVIGAIIGVGIFFSPGTVARIAGSPDVALAAWVLAGGLALCGALTFAALGSVYHGPGGQYEILRAAYGRFPAFLFVFCNATYIQAGAIAIIACLCVQNLGLGVSGVAPAGVHLLVWSSVLILGLAGANVLGVRLGTAIQHVTVLAKLSTLLLIVGLALLTPQQPAPPQTAAAAADRSPLLLALLAAMAPCFFAYGGWQHALWISGEVRTPQRNVPAAILIGVSIVVVVYVAAAWAFQHLLGFDRVLKSNALAADAVATVWP